MSYLSLDFINYFTAEPVTQTTQEDISAKNSKAEEKVSAQRQKMNSPPLDIFMEKGEQKKDKLSKPIKLDYVYDRCSAIGTNFKIPDRFIAESDDPLNDYVCVDHESVKKFKMDVYKLLVQAKAKASKIPEPDLSHVRYVYSISEFSYIEILEKRLRKLDYPDWFWGKEEHELRQRKELQEIEEKLVIFLENTSASDEIKDQDEFEII